MKKIILIIGFILLFVNGYGQSIEALRAKADSIRVSDSIAAVEAASSEAAAAVASEYESQVVNGVAGIDFGCSYDKAKKILEERYGVMASYSTINNISYYNISVGTIEFQSADFGFQYGKSGLRCFNQATFSTPYELSELKDAIKTREYIKGILSKKYVIETIIQNSMKYYVCGVNELCPDGYVITLGVFKSKSKSGKYYYYVTLSYGPVNYINNDDL